MKNISILDYECGNVFSLENAIKKFNKNVNITYNKKDLLDSDIIFLPGVGSFPAAMNDLKKKNLDEFFFKELISQNKTIVGICLGFQLLFSSSNEFKYTKGLNILEGKVESILELSKLKIKKTNMGWTKIYSSSNLEFFKDINNKYFFFAHSFCLQGLKISSGVEISKSKFLDVEFISCIKKENIIGFQFHPEKSGVIGLDCIKRIVI